MSSNSGLHRHLLRELRVGATIVTLVAVVALSAGAARADTSGSVTPGLLSAGDAHTCVVLDGGAVRCWGSGADGRLGYGNDHNVGDGSGPSIEQAGDVPVGGPVRAISAGPADTCALLETGGVRCWGDGEGNRLGYGGGDVGDGTGSTIEQAGDVRLPGRATAVAAGASHTCAILVGGAVDCWGDGAGPHTVTGVDRAGVLGAGGDQTCVVTAAGGVQCWSGSEAPAAVSLAADDPAVDIAVGTAHACAVLGSGEVTCWTFDDTGAASSPSEIALAAGAVGVAAGGNRTCALLDVGAVECWDSGGSPDGVAVTSGATALAVGPDHACVLLSSGLSCWGSGADGRLGYGDTTTRSAPAVAGGAGSSPSATSASSARARVTFGGGPQAGGSRAQPARAADVTHRGSTPWVVWVATAAVLLAAAVGSVLWRRRRVDSGPPAD